MHPVDLVFSNLRLAPVQVTSYGHSSSTHGSAIDYFIGGEEVEYWQHSQPSQVPVRCSRLFCGVVLSVAAVCRCSLSSVVFAQENPQRRYSERLLLAPGM
jgi:hypothetical protein